VSYPGLEYLVDAYGCDPGTLASIDRLNSVVERLMRDLKLRPVGKPMWHAFATSNAVTGMILLSDSHVAVHAFPDIQFAAFSLYYGAMRSPGPGRRGSTSCSALDTWRSASRFADDSCRDGTCRRAT